jgi:hypothetical protein
LPTADLRAAGAPPRAPPPLETLEEQARGLLGGKSDPAAITAGIEEGHAWLR